MIRDTTRIALEELIRARNNKMDPQRVIDFYELAVGNRLRQLHGEEPDEELSVFLERADRELYHAYKRLGKYWYLFTHEECVLCWKFRVYKHRMYSAKPEDPADRHVFVQFACDGHFL